MKTVWFSERRDKKINGTERKAHKYSQLIFDKSAKTIQNRNDSLLTKNTETIIFL